MPKFRFVWLPIVGVALVASGCVSAKKYNAVDALASSLRKDLDAANRRGAGLAEELARLKADLAAAEVTIADLTARRDALKASNSELQATLGARSDAQARTIAKLTDEKQALEARIAELERAKAELEAAIEREVARVKSSYDALVGSLESELKAGNVRIEQLEGRLTVSVADRLFFESGRAVVRPDGQAVLRKVAEVLADLPERAVRIEGHTDDVPISGALAQVYPTNWELGAARAVNVVRFLVEEAGLDPQRLAGVTFGQHQPVADNATSEGRARNRRIEIVLAEPERRAPAAAPATPAP